MLAAIDLHSLDSEKDINISNDIAVWTQTILWGRVRVCLLSGLWNSFW